MGAQKTEFSTEFTLTRLAAKIIRDNLSKSPIEIGNLIVREFHSKDVVIKSKQQDSFYINTPEVKRDNCNEFIRVEPLIKEVK